MSFRTRLGLLVAASVAVAVLATSGAVLWIARNEARAALDEQIWDRVEILQFGTERLPEPIRVRSLGRYITYDVMLQVIGPDGSVGYFSERTLPVSGTDRALAAGDRSRVHWADIDADGVRMRAVTVPLGRRGALMVARPLTEVDASIHGLRNAMAVVAVAGVAGAGLLGFWVASRAIRPVRRLTAAARSVAQTQDLDQPIEIERDDELGELAASFNAMLEALAVSRAQQHRLVTDAGHELRTPLTSIRTNIELLARAEHPPAPSLPEQEGEGLPNSRPELGPDERRQMLDDVLFELDQLTDLMAELIELATDQRSLGEPTVIDLADVVAAVANRHRRRSGVEIVTTFTPCRVQANVALVERAISNLVDNAVKWSPSGEPIEISVVRDVDQAIVRVADRGPGIDPGLRQLVFERFFRAPEARALPGSGLGLSIVDYVAHTHGGSAAVVETDGPGTTVEFRLPLAPGPDSPPADID
ncbi:MAG: HAMP domain-containing histidine kinase [Acidimicrobiales bacterium]|nr:HAMP domain-containing histidine kinase [Acidimicrobiales bacterium]MYG89236.1 HAMP domain-containing histidine kinase [Acidimicrobiales bacterium]MYI29067.1 HAMP domain-containing histidine kinase [Acidimicrobiales bacterium]